MTTSPTLLPIAPAGSGIAYRHYRGLEEIPGMAAANAKFQAHIGRLGPVDVAAMQHRFTHLVNSDAQMDCIVAVLDGRTVGFSRAEWHDLVDGDRIYDIRAAVDPAAWGQGIWDGLLTWTEARLRVVARENRTSRRSWFASFAFGGDDEGIDALLRHGYEAVRWDAEMLRPDLDDIPDVPAPAGYVLRVPEADEMPAVFAMTVAAFREHWGEYESGDHHLDEWLDDPRFRRDLVVVAWAGDQPAACVANVLMTAPDGSIRGLLDGVSTHPAHRRRGLARAAIAESLRLLRDAGARSAYLGVDTDNQNRALALYESCGFRVASRGASYRKPFDGPETDR